MQAINKSIFNRKLRLIPTRRSNRHLNQITDENFRRDGATARPLWSADFAWWQLERLFERSARFL